MNDFIDWGLCEREFVRKVSTDQEKIASLRETALKRRQFIEQITVDETNVSFVVEQLYEVVKELLVALLLQAGLRSKNHQCLITYFYRTHPEHEPEAFLITQLSYRRNRLDYYGELIDPAFYERNKEAIARVIDVLLALLGQ